MRRRAIDDYVAWGGPDEAASYFEMAADTWAETPGALAWLADRLGPAPARPRAKTARSPER